MNRKDLLIKHQIKLKEDISTMLDSFLIGSISRSPSMTGHSLTTKVDGKTVTIYVRKAVLSKATDMSNRYKKLWKLMQALSKINWELLILEHK